MKRETFVASVFIAVVFLVISIILAIQILTTRTQTINELNTNISNLSHTLDTYSEGIIRQSEMLIKNISDITEIYGINSGQISNIKKILTDQNQLLQQLNNIIIYDENGNKVIALHEKFSGSSNSADRFFFVHHRDSKSKKIFIGPPVISRTNGQWVITVSRRLEDTAGHFKGVAVLTLNIENFLETYGKLDIGQHGAIALTSESGILLIRYPFDNKYIGRELSDSPLFTNYLKKGNSGTAKSISRLDKIERIYSFQKNRRYGLVTTVAVSMDEALATWRHQSESLAVIVIFLAGCIIFSGYFLIRDVRRRAQISRELSKAQESLLSANAELKVMASEDGLTGLANRRKFDEALPTEVLKCAKNKRPISLLLIDVDYFKKYNDGYGHIAGDECLRKVADSLKQTIKGTVSIAARYGGEEFVVILPATDSTAAEDIAKEIAQNIKQGNILHEYSPLGMVSVSIGVASLLATVVKGRETQFVELADKALYNAKYSGRNRVVSSTCGM